MKCEFVLFGINDISMIYTYNESGEKEYHGVSYIGSVLAKVNDKIPSLPEATYHCGFQRNANEVFLYEISDEKYYEMIFRLDTYAEKQKLTVQIRNEYLNGASEKYLESEAFDDVYEQIKIELKNVLLSDWNKCVWVIDQQSEQLCALLYPRIFKAENAIRAFASKVLIQTIGPNWIQMPGMEKYRESCKIQNDRFTRMVREFHSVDTNFMSMSLETAFEVIKKGKIYKRDIEIAEDDKGKIFACLQNDKDAGKLQSVMRGMRTLSVDLWNDIFIHYIEVEDNITDFIGNRNHVAHNKLINIRAYNKISENIEAVEEMIHRADSKFETEKLSDEIKATIYEGDFTEYPEDEECTADYIRYRLSAEAEIEVHNREEIYQIFAENIDGLRTQIKNRLYFFDNLRIKTNFAFDFVENGDKQIILTINERGEQGKTMQIFAEYIIDDSLDADSELHIECRYKDNDHAECYRTIYYHNGSGYEDFLDEKMVVLSESSLDDSEIADMLRWLSTLYSVNVEDRKRIRKQNLPRNQHAYHKLKNDMVPKELKLGQFRKYYKPTLSTKEKDILIKMGIDPYSYDGLKYYGDCRRYHVALGEQIPEGQK